MDEQAEASQRALPLEPGDEIVGQLYAFEDRGGRKVALRPEMTPSLARMIAARSQGLAKPIKWYSIPRLFRTATSTTDSYATQLAQKAFNGFNGIWLGTLNILPLDNQYSTIDDDNWLDAMAETSDAPGRPVLNVLLVILAYDFVRRRQIVPYTSTGT